MRKYVLDLQVTSVEHVSERFLLLTATNPNGPLPEMYPGQFAQLRIDESKDTFLRRPISLHCVDFEKNEVEFLVQMVGKGTSSLQSKRPNTLLNVILPLGNGFTMPTSPDKKVLLVGGGVGLFSVLMILSLNAILSGVLLSEKSAESFLGTMTMIAFPHSRNMKKRTSGTGRPRRGLPASVRRQR